MESRTMGIKIYPPFRNMVRKEISPVFDFFAISMANSGPDVCAKRSMLLIIGKNYQINCLT
jgi:hypothetical protein